VTERNVVDFPVLPALDKQNVHIADRELESRPVREDQERIDLGQTAQHSPMHVVECDVLLAFTQKQRLNYQSHSHVEHEAHHDSPLDEPPSVGFSPDVIFYAFLQNRGPQLATLATH